MNQEQSFNARVAAPLIDAIEAFDLFEHRENQRPRLAVGCRHYVAPGDSLNADEINAYLADFYMPGAAQRDLEAELGDVAQAFGFFKALTTVLSVDHFMQRRRESLCAQVRTATDAFIRIFNEVAGLPATPNNPRLTVIYHPELDVSSLVTIQEISRLAIVPDTQTISLFAIVRLADGHREQMSFNIDASRRWNKYVHGGQQAFQPMRFDKEDQEKKNLTYNAEYLEATGGSKYTSSPAEALAHQQQKWNRWEQHLAAKRLPLLDEAAGIVRPAEGQPGFDPVAFGRDQQARRDNHRRALQDCIDRARMALSADTDSSPSTLASLSGKLRSFTLTENPDRLPQDALVNDLREELAVAEKLLLELTPAGLDAEVLARDDEPTMHALRAAAERGF